MRLAIPIRKATRVEARVTAPGYVPRTETFRFVRTRLGLIAREVRA